MQHTLKDLAALYHRGASARSTPQNALVVRSNTPPGAMEPTQGRRSTAVDDTKTLHIEGELNTSTTTSITTTPGSTPGGQQATQQVAPIPAINSMWQRFTGFLGGRTEMQTMQDTTSLEFRDSNGKRKRRDDEEGRAGKTKRTKNGSKEAEHFDDEVSDGEGGEERSKAGHDGSEGDDDL